MPRILQTTVYSWKTDEKPKRELPPNSDDQSWNYRALSNTLSPLREPSLDAHAAPPLDAVDIIHCETHTMTTYTVNDDC
jgi:hypothetical protein